MKIFALIFSAVLIWIAVWACTKTEPDKPDNSSDTSKVIITWPLNGHVTNQDSVVIQWGVDSANTGVVVQPTKTFHLDEGEMTLTLLDTNGRGVVGQAAVSVTRVSGTLFVNAAAVNNGDGNSWATAYRNLQTALARVTTGWDIWVAKGKYRPFEGTGLDSTYDTSFVMKTGADLFGGFTGNEKALGSRNWGLNETILSGERGDTVIGDNSGRIVLGANNASLDGFVIERGWGKEGSGMFNFLVTPQVVNCVFRDNANNLYFGGGGILNNSCSPQIQNCVFLRNRSADGGAIVNLSATPTIIRCLFVSNVAVNGGAVVSDAGSTASFDGCVFSGNSSARGGAVWDRGASASSMVNCFFNGNSSSTVGGALSLTSSNITIKNCVFTMNSARRGGAIDGYNSSLTLLNGVLSGNTATDSGGGIFLETYYNQTLISVIRNSILWGNVSYLSGPQIALRNDSTSSNTLNLSYSDLLGDTSQITEDGPVSIISGLGMIQVNPGFVNSASAAGADGVLFTADDGFNLNAGPCVNTGDPDPTGNSTYDILGNLRIQGTRVDMGSYEQ